MEVNITVRYKIPVLPCFFLMILTPLVPLRTHLYPFFLLRNVSQELDLDGLSLPDSECFFDVPSQLRYDFEFLGLVVGGAAESDRSSFSDNLGDIRPRPTEGFELD